MSKRLCLLLMWFCVVSLLSAQPLIVEQQQKLEVALEQLKNQRSEIAAKKIPLTKELKELEARADELRGEMQDIRRLQDSREISLDTLRQQIQDQQREIDYIQNTLLPDYVAEWESLMSAGKLASVGEVIRSYHIQQQSNSTMGQSLTLLEASFQDLQESIAGDFYNGKIITENDEVIEASYAQVGPYLFAKTKAGAGVVVETQTAYPRLVTMDQMNAFQPLEPGEESVVPLDPTLGEALQLEQTRDEPLEHIQKGGVWVYPILGFAIVATLVALYKSIQIFSIRDAKPQDAHQLVLALREKDQKQAEAIVGRQPEPTRAMLQSAVANADESVDLVEEVMYESMLKTQPQLEKFLNIIAVTAATAPLLGLLGTVTGIIKTFQLMSVYGAGDPKPLISGISEALITTELGLALAIPALVLHALLSRRVSGILSRMEKTALALVNGLSRKVKD